MYKIQIHSTVDIITNSSSLTFTKKGDKDIIKQFLLELFGYSVEVLTKGDICDCYSGWICSYCNLEDSEYLFSVDQNLNYLGGVKFGELIGAKYVD